MELDFEARYKVAGWEGIAFRIYGYAQKWEPYVSEDEEGNEIELDDGEFTDDTSKILVVMVGDDRKIEVSPEDLTLINDDDYCSECGQIGCTADGRSE